MHLHPAHHDIVHGPLPLIAALLFGALLLATPAAAATTLTYASNGPEQSVRGYDEKLFLDEIENSPKAGSRCRRFGPICSLPAMRS